MIEYFALIAIFFSSFVYGVIGFADALVLLPIITPIIGVKNGVILVNIWGTLTSFLNFIKYRKYLDKGYYFRFISLGVPATIFGTFLIIDIGTEWIELMFGIFILGYSIFKLYQYSKSKNEIEGEIRLDTRSPVIFFGGFTYGFLTALISAAGPVNVALLERTGHYRENFIENFGAIGFTLSMARNPFYLVTGIFPYELLLIFLLGFPIILIGTRVGQKITPKIPIKTFQVIIFCFLIGISLKSIITAIFRLI
jgi:uncharacterized membrane protein YfcA